MLTISHPLQLLNLSECQKSSWFIIFEVQLIQELCGLTGPKHFCPHLTKICKTPFMFLESISHVKNQIASWFRYSWLKNPAIWLEERIFNLKFKKHRLRFLNLYLHVKNQVEQIFAWVIVDLRILQSHWLRAFKVITQEPQFSQI